MTSLQQVPWSYTGDHGPEAWGDLHPAFAACSRGRQQSPIHITQAQTVLGPTEPLRPSMQAFGGTVVHTGHAVAVDATGEQTLSLRGSSWRLVRVEFRHPAEERIDHQGFAMATDLVYRNAQDRWAVLSVPMQLGAANPFIAQVWTHMPLQAQDSVRLPDSGLKIQELLPTDGRYYQYLGSLTTPPCTEGVLRLVLKSPASVSLDQWRLLTQMTPPNARPTQALHDRIVRSAQ